MDTHAERSASELAKSIASRLYLEVFGEGHVEVADELMAADCVSNGPGTPPVIGTDQIKRQAAILRTAMPDLAVSLEDQLADEDRVCSRWHATGTSTGALHLFGTVIPPTGGPVEFEEIRIDRIVGGRIVESWFIPDRFSVWQQLGVLPAVAR